MSSTIGYKRVSSMGGTGDLGKQLPGAKRNVERDDMDEETTSPAYTSYRELVEQLVRRMKEINWHLVPRVGGDVAGFNVYTAASPKLELQLTGLQFNRGFKYLARVKPDDSRFSGFIAELLAEINCRKMTATCKTTQGMWANIAKSFIDRPKDGRSDVAMVSMGLGEGVLRRTITGATGQAAKFVPRVEWFPESVRELDVPALFSTMMPDAEAKAFMLMVGKTLLGNPGTKLVEGEVPDSKFAALSVLIGFDGGEGKSTLLGYIAEAMELCGYEAATIDPDSNRFSNLWVTSDIAISDELDDDAHQRLLSRWALIKSVVSGQKRVLVEAKGVQSWEVTPTAQPFFNSNNYSDVWLQKSNGGMLRRYNPLHCYNREEMQQRFGDNWKQQRLPSLWQRRAKELGVTIQCLTARVLRYCLDLYCDTIGIVITEHGKLSWKWEDNKLEEVLEGLRSQYHIKVDMGHGKRLVDAIEMVTLAAMKLVESRYRAKLLERIPELPLMPKALHTVVDIWRVQEDLPEALSGMYFGDISNNVRLTWDAQTDALYQDCLSKTNPNKVWERVIEALTVKGKEWGFQKSISSYSARWNTKLTTLRAKLEQIPDESIDAIPELTHGYLKELSDRILVTLNITKQTRGGSSRR